MTLTHPTQHSDLLVLYSVVWCKGPVIKRRGGGGGGVWVGGGGGGLTNQTSAWEPPSCGQLYHS